MAPVDFSGTWKLEKSENLEDYLKEMGVGWMFRKMAMVAGGNIAQTIIQDGDSFAITVTNPKGKNEEKFTVGEEYEHSMPPVDEKCKCITKWDGNVLVLDVTPLDTKKKPQHILRELINETEMLITIHIGDIVSKRFFRKQ